MTAVSGLGVAFVMPAAEIWQLFFCPIGGDAAE